MQTAHDIICHDTIHPTPNYAQAEYGGRRYYFCGARCRDAFLEDPVSAIDGEQSCPDSEARHRTAHEAPEPMVGIGVHSSWREITRWRKLLNELGYACQIEYATEDGGRYGAGSWPDYRVPYAILVSRSQAREARSQLRRRGLLID